MSAPAILIIDDNPKNAKLASRVLQFAGYFTVAADSAEAAQALLQESPSLPLALILMDIGLPGMDGLDLTRWLKQDERFRQIPVVALTAYAMQGDDKVAYDAGCCGYIVKPIDTRTFADEVGTFLKA